MAIKALHWLLKIYDETIYCYHEIVHNKWIVKIFEQNNVIFVEDPSEIPRGSIVMLSAHGTAPDIEENFNDIASVSINSSAAFLPANMASPHHHLWRPA